MAITSLDKLPRKIPKTPKKEEIMAVVTDTVRRVRTKTKGRKNSLVRTPDVDTATIGGKDKTQATKVEDKKTCIGDFWQIQTKQKYQHKYQNKLAAAAQAIPEATYVGGNELHGTKSWDSALKKIKRFEEQFETKGFNGIVRDVTRDTMYIPKPKENYKKIVKEMHDNQHMRLAKAYAEDANGNIVIGKDGLPIMADDIEFQSAPSGYKGVQVRFEEFKLVKNSKTGKIEEAPVNDGHVYELIILPGPNYHAFKDYEHVAVYEHTRQYKEYGFTKDKGADTIIKGIKNEIGKVTEALYNDAAIRDEHGTNAIKEAVTFTPKGIKNLTEYFDALENLLLGKYMSLPPSKRKLPFKETLKYRQAREIRTKLMEFVKLYAPKD